MALNIVPDLVETAASDLSRVGDTITEASTAARLSTTAMVPAGLDEVSAAVTNLFNSHGQGFQAITQQAAGVHQQFITNLTQAAGSYRGTEQAIGQALRDGITRVEQLATGTETVVPPPPAPTNVNPIGLVIGGTTEPVPTPAWLATARTVYGVSNPYPVFTPEQGFPFTPQLGSLTLGQSVTQGQQLLNAAIMAQLGAGNQTTVVGVSQGAMVETAEVRHLMSIGSPGTDKLSFIMTGDPNNPNGGFFTRLPGLRLPFFGVTHDILGATPPNSPYPTTIYTNQYDPVANFPHNPLNVVSDLNALFGWSQHYYQGPNQVSNAVLLPTSPGYTGSTQYYMTLDQTLPLVEFFRWYGGSYGNAFADLLQPDLRVLVDMGYQTGGYANVPTPFGFNGLPNIPVISHDLTVGTEQGVQGFAHDLGFPVNAPTGYPYSPVLNPNLHIG